MARKLSVKNKKITASAKKKKTPNYLFEMLWDFYERIGEVIARPEIENLHTEHLKIITADLSRINADLRHSMGITPKNWIVGDNPTTKKKKPAAKKATAKKRANK